MSEGMLGHISLSELRGLRDQVEDRLAGKNSARYVEELKKWLREEPCWVKLDFDTFFQTRSGLYVDESFLRLVFAEAGPSKAVETNHFGLPCDMSDAEIEKKLREDLGPHIWDEGDLCATLQKWLTEQEGGKAGKLLNNGYANIFYTSSCVVRVFWNSGIREWNVGAWGRGGDGWGAGGRAFFPAPKQSEARDGAGN